MADIVEIKTKDIRYSASNDNFQYIYRENKDCYLYEFNEKTLFETKEEAKWFAEFGNIERTERLVLPTWEEFQNVYDICFVCVKTGTTVRVFNWNFSGEIYISDEWGISENFEYSKDGYTLACRKAKELFLGQSKDS